MIFEYCCYKHEHYQKSIYKTYNDKAVKFQRRNNLYYVPIKSVEILKYKIFKS